MLNSNELPKNKVHSTLKMFGLISVILLLASLLINDYPSITGPIVFFTLNLLIQLAELKKSNNIKTKIKLFVLPCFITVIYCINLLSLDSFLDEEFLLILALFFLNFLILPFSQLWLQNINPFTTPHSLVIKILQNLMNCFLIWLGLIIFLFFTPHLSFFIPNEIKEKTFLYYILLMLWVFFLFRFMNQRLCLSKYLLNIFSIFLKVCLIFSCCLSIIFAGFIIFNVPTYDYKNYMNHMLIIFQGSFIITILLTQSLWLQPNDKKFNRFNTFLYYLVFFTFSVILFSIITLLTIYFGSQLINELAPTIFLRLTFQITLGVYILSYLCLCIGSMSYGFFSNHNLPSFLSKHKSKQFDKQLIDSELKATKSDKKDTTLLIKILRSFRPNLAVFNKQVHYFNSIFITIFIVASSYALSPFFNLNAILTDRHVNRLLNNQVSVEEFNFGVLENALGNEGEAKFDNLIEIAKAANYPHLKRLEKKLSIYKDGEPSNEPSIEIQEKNISDYYQQNLYENLTIRPHQNTIEQNVLDKIILNSILYTYEKEQCLFNPNKPDNKIMAKCFIDVIHPNINQPKEKIYAVTTIYWTEYNYYEQKVVFYRYENEQLIQIDSNLLVRCKDKSKDKFIDFKDFYQNISSKLTLFNPPYYLLKHDDTVYGFTKVCN